MDEQLKIIAAFSEEKSLTLEERNNLNRTGNEVADGEVARELGEKETNKIVSKQESLEGQTNTSKSEYAKVNRTVVYNCNLITCGSLASLRLSVMNRCVY